MSDKYCCRTWKELSIELSSAKEAEINDLMTTSKLPRSVFATVFSVLEGMTNHCPVCGSVLNPELQPKLKQQHVEAVKEIKAAVQESPTYTLQKHRCAACAGRGNLGTDKNRVKINCMKCHGSGELESKHIAVDPKAAQGMDKVDQIREEKKLGDGAINIDARGEV